MPKVPIKLNRATSAKGEGTEQLLCRLTLLHDVYPRLSTLRSGFEYGKELLQCKYCDAVSNSKSLFWYAEA